MNLNGDKVKYLTFDIFKNIDFINHCFSTRIGGVSEGFFSSLNLGFRKGESREKVIENFKLLGKEAGFDYKNIVRCIQEHKDNVMIAEESLKGTLEDPNKFIPNADGIITNEKNFVLTTFYADCIPVYFVDKEKKAIALCHSGWKGTVLKISVKTVKKMIEEYGSSVKNILVGIGPSICKNCFEVDLPVYLEFKKSYDYIDDFTTYNIEKNKYYIDMQNIIKKSLMDFGILEQNIELPNCCTKEDLDLFFSHRKMGEERGSLAAFLWLV